ncbi:carbonic anhydrase 15 [Electrophorus electricus]|uniref:carbonic anhydrase 15 n=1 Tax=Electrophorus electricus TaxID=8005 RepID=UPI0015D0274E|nr:carbonic anhydrase 15 [Electrophorus electricus]
MALSGQVMAVLMASAFQVSSADYCYGEDYCNPYEWSKTYFSCTPDYTKHHSPIDISARVMKNDSLPPLIFTGFHVVQSSWLVANTRDTVVVEVQKGMKVSGGGLRNEYQIVEMRFHWGSRTTNGSEHTFNKRRFPMEMQLVGLAPGFQDVFSASKEQSGLAKLGVFIDIGDENVPFKAISDAIPSLSFPGQSVNVTPPALLDLMPNYTNRFYCYSGSQTAPPCFPTVQWIVFEKPIFISQKQYLVFATGVYYSDEDDPKRKLLVENYRHVQSSAMRSVFASPDAAVLKSQGASPVGVFGTILILLLPCMLRMA